MENQFYVLHLLPSRPDFAFTMTEQERAIMMQHVAYWADILNQGKVYAFGPVKGPKEVYGIAIVKVSGEEELKKLMANDPASQLNRYEYFPMMRAVVPELKLKSR